MLGISQYHTGYLCRSSYEKESYMANLGKLNGELLEAYLGKDLSLESALSCVVAWDSDTAVSFSFPEISCTVFFLFKTP